jgi:hypothetical protein
MPLSSYFDYFPKITYDIQGKQLSNYNVTTNIFFRLRIIRSILSNISSYYEYLVKDTDTPEILADKIYNDSGAHWIILMANDMIDAQYDWPLNYTDFNKYIIKKYGSIANAKTQIHHYEKVVTREEQLSGVVTESRFVINHSKLTNNTPDVPYDYYDNLPETQEFNTYNLQNGTTVNEVIKRDAITCYDYESQLNDNKRAIKIIKPVYYPQIMEEFKKLSKVNEAPYIRKLV